MHVVENDAEGENVNIDSSVRLLHQKLWCHITSRATGRYINSTLLIPSSLSSQTKVENFDAHFCFIDHDVLRLEVPVTEAFRVDVVHSLSNLLEEETTVRLL